MSKYNALAYRLATELEPLVSLTFSDIESLVGPLPPSAWEHDEWWANESNPHTHHMQSRAWMGAGWDVGRVDLDRHIVTFKRRVEHRH